MYVDASDDDDEEKRFNLFYKQMKKHIIIYIQYEILELVYNFYLNFKYLDYIISMYTYI